MSSQSSSSANYNAPNSDHNSSNIGNNWDPDDFSRSSNGLLESLGSNQTNSIIDVISAYYSYFEENLLNPDLRKKSKNNHVTWLLQLRNYLEPNTNKSKLNFYTSGELASAVIRNVKPVKLSKSENKIVIRLFLAGILLEEYESILSVVQADKEFRNIVQKILHSLENELPQENPPVNLQEHLTDAGIKTWSKIFIKEEPEVPETGNISDSPAVQDLLSRRTMAKYLSKRLNYIYKNQIKGMGAFFMHIDGAWGSGKSTLLRYLKEYLTGDTSDETYELNKTEPEWIVIEFDAWANQRLDPPWWFIMKNVYRGTRSAFAKRKKYGKYLGLWFREHFWRLNTGTNYLIMAIITAAISVFALYSGINTPTGFSSLNIVQLLSFVSFIWSSTKFFNTSLVPGSARAAQNFIQQNGNDPMSVLASHFKKQLNYIHQPLTIFIDNLDRCNQSYGIQLLEGLQTIFRDAPVVYVVAADRKWLAKMYENQYGIFADAIAKPAKPFGLIFLDKIFQYIVELPSISAVQKLEYWNYLLQGAKAKDQGKLDEVRASIRAEVESRYDNKGKINLIASSGKKGFERQILREEIVNSLSIGEEEKRLENKLSEFCDIVEPNPRSMKRIINDMSTLKALTILYEQNIKEEELILYTILKLQFPQLSEFFWDNPEKLDDLHDSKSEVIGDKNLDALLKDPEVKKLFCYSMKDNSEHKLDSDFMRRMKFEKID